MRVALIQRIFPAYRVSVFETLAQRPGIDLTVFHGRGTRQGPWQNSSRNGRLTTVEMSTIGGRLTWGGRNYYLAYHPGLLWNLFRGKFDAVLADFTYVRLSLDAGTAETHAAMHDVPGHFEKIIQNTRALVVARRDQVPTIGIQFATHHENIGDLKTGAMLAKGPERRHHEAGTVGAAANGRDGREVHGLGERCGSASCSTPERDAGSRQTR